MKPLEGIRVLDIATYIAAPYCATIMAEFGAEVIKVEMPGGGDPCRRLGSVTEAGDTLVWLSEARNKKSITLNLKDPKGKEMLKQLARHQSSVKTWRRTMESRTKTRDAPIGGWTKWNA